MLRKEGFGVETVEPVEVDGPRDMPLAGGFRGEAA
jgi:hypothetical protein